MQEPSVQRDMATHRRESEETLGRPAWMGQRLRVPGCPCWWLQRDAHVSDGQKSKKKNRMKSLKHDYLLKARTMKANAANISRHQSCDLCVWIQSVFGCKQGWVLRRSEKRDKSCHSSSRVSLRTLLCSLLSCDDLRKLLAEAYRQLLDLTGR